MPQRARQAWQYRFALPLCDHDRLRGSNMMISAAAGGVVASGPRRQRLPQLAPAAEAGPGPGLPPGLQAPLCPLVAPRQVPAFPPHPPRSPGMRVRPRAVPRGDCARSHLVWKAMRRVDWWDACRWEAWVMRAAEPRGLPFQATLRLLLAQRLGLTVPSPLLPLRLLSFTSLRDRSCPNCNSVRERTVSMPDKRGSS